MSSFYEERQQFRNNLWEVKKQKVEELFLRQAIIAEHTNRY